MKREILCEECAKGAREQFPTDNPYPGEFVKFVHGFAIRPFVCDHCSLIIKEGDACTAFSIWATYGGAPYYEWENQFIKIGGHNEPGK